MADLEKIGDILEKMIASTKLGDHLEHAQVWRHWHELVGPELGMHGRPKDVDKGVLHIEVDSAVWMHRYTLKKFGILKKINRFAGRELFSDIFVELHDPTAAGEPEKPKKTPKAK